jgi:hypothetical protein
MIHTFDGLHLGVVAQWAEMSAVPASSPRLNISTRGSIRECPRRRLQRPWQCPRVHDRTCILHRGANSHLEHRQLRHWVTTNISAASVLHRFDTMANWCFRIAQRLAAVTAGTLNARTTLLTRCSPRDASDRQERQTAQEESFVELATACLRLTKKRC